MLAVDRISKLVLFSFLFLTFAHFSSANIRIDECEKKILRKVYGQMVVNSSASRCRKTFDEIWLDWTQSDVFNWKEEDVENWLVYWLNLPQYANQLRKEFIDGSKLPRLTSSSYLSSRIKVIDRVDRQKIVLNALHLIIFNNNAKIYSSTRLLTACLVILLISLVIIIKRWHKTILLIAQTEDQLQYLRTHRQSKSSNYSSADSSTSSCNNKCNFYKPARMSETLRERELRLLQEIVFTRERLEYCEKLLDKLHDENLPFDKLKLQKCLQLTFEMELNFYTSESMRLEREIMTLEKKRLNLAKKDLARDEIYSESIKLLRIQSQNLMNETVEFRKRWAIIERLCGFGSRENPALNGLKCDLEESPSSSCIKMSSLSELSVDSDHSRISSNCSEINSNYCLNEASKSVVTFLQPSTSTFNRRSSSRTRALYRSRSVLSNMMLSELFSQDMSTNGERVFPVKEGRKFGRIIGNDLGTSLPNLGRSYRSKKSPRIDRYWW